VKGFYTRESIHSLPFKNQNPTYHLKMKKRRHNNKKQKAITGITSI
jgi:hypothetical protein